MSLRLLSIAVAAAVVVIGSVAAVAQPESRNGYASVNGLKMYYEIHGSGQPLILIHGAFMSIDSAFEELIPLLAEERQIVAVELQGHGRTADIDRPLSYEQMADDVAALMGDIGVGKADILGYSMGGGIALQMAIRHPSLVRKLVVISATFNSGGYRPGILAGVGNITTSSFADSPFEAEYRRLAPRPEDWPKLIEKVKRLNMTVQDWLPEAIMAIKAPALIVVGDSDAVSLTHAIELFRLMGGDVAGDLVELPRSRLAVIPGTTHITVILQTDLLASIILPFLDVPMRPGASPADRGPG